jgi:predicted transcriptional regulator
MEQALWYLLAGTRGGENRARIIRSLDERPKNANRLSESLDLDYKTVRHHIEMLEEYGIVESGGNDYGEMYFLTDRFEENRGSFEEIVDRVEGV